MSSFFISLITCFVGPRVIEQTIGQKLPEGFQHSEFLLEHGMIDLNLLYDIPTIFCVLTDNTMQQSIDRSGGKHGNKGIEAAIAAIKMIELNKRF
jgi:hypothetical protein